MGTVLPYAVLSGDGYQNVWAVLSGNGAVCAAIWVRFVGCHIPHSAGAGELP